MLIENQKTYDAQDVEKIFFRPSFCGQSANDFGIRVLYNMPLPTTVQVFSHYSDILRDFAPGWEGGSAVNRGQKDINMVKIKAESAYSAEDYFSTIYEIINNSEALSLDDLSGTELEKAETELFRRSIVESVYASTWVGDIENEVSDQTTFDGLLRQILIEKDNRGDRMAVLISDTDPSYSINELLQYTWSSASEELRSLVSDGQLAFFVTSDVYDAYQLYLDTYGGSASYVEYVNGRPSLYYHGIPIVEVPVMKYGAMMCKSFCLLTDRRNLVLALNTADSPEKGIRMWYNPDEMENRQRAVFLAGTALLDYRLISGVISHEKMVDL
ncbi:MAG: hypothetical protein IKV09_04290 [Alistipes sp.]|nr:hypothetical protein [Alistipes sp.]